MLYLFKVISVDLSSDCYFQPWIWYFQSGINLILILPRQTSSWAIEFTAVPLLPAAAADIDITVTYLVGH